MKKADSKPIVNESPMVDVTPVVLLATWEFSLELVVNTANRSLELASEQRPAPELSPVAFRGSLARLVCRRGRIAGARASTRGHRGTRNPGAMQPRRLGDDLLHRAPVNREVGPER